MEGESNGLNILLSVVTLLFIIGLVVFVFTLMAGGFDEATSETATGVIANESIANFTDSGTALSVEGLDGLEFSDVVVEGCT